MTLGLTSPVWRFIDTGELSGQENMAIDEALLACFDPETSAPVLRFYGWSPPTISLGRFQKAEELLNLQKCENNNLKFVSRMTGGGIIYHADELTYSITCSTKHIPKGTGVKESFRILTSFLLNFYRGLGLKPEYSIDCLSPYSHQRAAFCFAGRESYDILINRKKIGGNAQKRLKNVIFQHGSIPLIQRVDIGSSYLLQECPEVINETTSIQEQGVPIDKVLLKQALKESFKFTFNLSLIDDALTDKEIETAEKNRISGKRNGKR
ncbi:MAG: lipoate--protein ligase family protein [Desulfuromonadales bacterium]|nr:lipoate--protein ligase family protein [Desulfuromonadales bacterium]